MTSAPRNDMTALADGIYIASKTKHAHRWLALRDAGEPIISTWIDEAGEGQSADLHDLWRRCVSEAASCRVLIVYREADDVLKGGWVEVGAALASGVPVYAVGLEGYTISLYRGITHFPTVEAAFSSARRVTARAAVPVSSAAIEAAKTIGRLERDPQNSNEEEIRDQQRIIDAALAAPASDEVVAWREEIEAAADIFVGTMTGLPTGDDVAEWLSSTLIPNIEERAAAHPAPTAPVRDGWDEALKAEDERQTKLHDLLETIREQIRLGVAAEHRPDGLFQNIQDAVYAMRGRTPLMSDARLNPDCIRALTRPAIEAERDTGAEGGEDYRIVPHGGGYEPQHRFAAGKVAGLFWYPLNEEGFWLEPDAFSHGNPKKRSIMSHEAANRSVLRARAINQQHIAGLPSPAAVQSVSDPAPDQPRWPEDGSPMQSAPESTSPVSEEEIARMLWHRFAPDHHIEWEDETHKAEYRDAARAILALIEERR